MEQTPYLENPFQAARYADNPDPRCPCVLVLDRSGSMAGQPIAELNAGLQQFRAELLGDEMAARRVEIAVVPFGPVVRGSAFHPPTEFQPQPLTAGGDTPTGAALEYAVELIVQQKAAYKQHGVPYYRPWIILITDGQPTDELAPRRAADPRRRAAEGVRVLRHRRQRRRLRGARPARAARRAQTAGLGLSRVLPVALGLALGRLQEHGRRARAAAAAPRAGNRSSAGRVSFEPEVWRAIGASVAGSSHAATMTRCQDFAACAIVRRPDGGEVLLAALADGAGSAACSHHGARTAVEAALASLRARAEAGAQLGPDDALDALRAARERVLEVAAEYEHPAREYASTLLIVLAGPHDGVALQIGDGAVVVDDGELRAATWPAQGEYANSTHFLTDDDALEQLQCAELGAARRIALFSDGLQALALHYGSRSAHEPFFAPFFAYLETSPKGDGEIETELRAYLESDGVNARTDDDKSLLLAVRR